jgi:hypothetical protein
MNNENKSPHSDTQPNPEPDHSQDKPVFAPSTEGNGVHEDIGAPVHDVVSTTPGEQHEFEDSKVTPEELEERRRKEDEAEAERSEFPHAY